MIAFAVILALVAAFAFAVGLVRLLRRIARAELEPPTQCFCCRGPLELGSADPLSLRCVDDCGTGGFEDRRDARIAAERETLPDLSDYEPSEFEAADDSRAYVVKFSHEDLWIAGRAGSYARCGARSEAMAMTMAEWNASLSVDRRFLVFEAADELSDKTEGSGQ